MFNAVVIDHVIVDLCHIPEGCVGVVDWVGVGIAGVCNVERENAGVGAVD